MTSLVSTARFLQRAIKYSDKHGVTDAANRFHMYGSMCLLMILNGDIICCLDESDSTKGDAAAWGKAIALTLLDIAMDSSRSFALIHFSGSGSRADVFRP